MPDPTIPELAAWCRRNAEKKDRDARMADFIGFTAAIDANAIAAANFRALAAILEGMQWRPIADATEAEKGPRGVLVYGGTVTTDEDMWGPEAFTGVAHVFWMEGKWFGGYAERYDDRIWHSPTHFMPLPPPPPPPETDR